MKCKPYYVISAYFSQIGYKLISVYVGLPQRIISHIYVKGIIFILVIWHVLL
jgi:hypothetical protein